LEPRRVVEAGLAPPVSMVRKNGMPAFRAGGSVFSGRTGEFLTEFFEYEIG
jgi:hypothetical protein